MPAREAGDAVPAVPALEPAARAAHIRCVPGEPGAYAPALGSAPDHTEPCRGPWPASELDAARQRLTPLLRAYAEAGSDGRVWLRSPWGYQIPLFTPDVVSADALRRVRLAHDALAAGDVVGALVHVERPFRLSWLDAVAASRTLSREQLAVGVLFAWEQLYLAYPVEATGLRLLRRVGFTADLDGDLSFNRPAWLRGDLVGYRGASDPAHVGASWTRDPDVARDYARYYPGRSTVLTGVVRAADVRAYWRQDETVAAAPRRVRVTATCALE